MGGRANAPHFSVATLPARNGFQELRFWSEQAPRGAAAPRGERWEPPRAGARLPGVTEGGWRKMRDLLPPLSSYVFSREVGSRYWERKCKSESDAWRRSAAAVFPLRKCRRRRLSLKGDASRKPLSSALLLLELGRHWLPRGSRSGGGVMDARRGGRASLAAPAPPRRGPRPGPRCRRGSRGP